MTEIEGIRPDDAPWAVIVPHISKTYLHDTKEDATGRGRALAAMFGGADVTIRDDLKIVTVDLPCRECCP